MKTQSIIKIEAMLQQNKKTAEANYDNYCKQLSQKYGSAWNNEKIAKAEFDILRRLKNACKEANELYEDFTNHKW